MYLFREGCSTPPSSLVSPVSAKDSSEGGPRSKTLSSMLFLYKPLVTFVLVGILTHLLLPLLQPLVSPGSTTSPSASPSKSTTTKQPSTSQRPHYTQALGVLLVFAVMFYYFFSVSPLVSVSPLQLSQRDAPVVIQQQQPSAASLGSSSPIIPVPRLPKPVTRDTAALDGAPVSNGQQRQAPPPLLPPPTLARNPGALMATSTTSTLQPRNLLHTFGAATSSQDIVDAVGRVGDAGCRGGGAASGQKAAIEGLPTECLELGRAYEARLVGRGCPGGGDYWEFLLMGPSYLGRPLSVDHGDGNFSLTVELPNLPDLLPGTYTLFAHLLFEGGMGYGGEGVDWTAEHMLGLDDGISLSLNFQGSCGTGGDSGGGGGGGGGGVGDILPPTCPSLSSKEVPLVSWQGYWLKVPPSLLNLPCEPPFCAPGSAPIPLVMEDNSEGWVYRRRECVFHLTPPSTARTCLTGKHIWAVGDSTMQDTVRNFMTDALRVAPEAFMADAQFLPRSANFSGDYPGIPSEGIPPLSLTFTLLFAGHHDVLTGGEGVRTYLNPAWMKAWDDRWESHPPDILFANDAGLHSAQWTAKVGSGAYPELVDIVKTTVLPVWLRGGAAAGGGSGPHDIIYRTSVSPALEHRSHRGNPQSMEAHNGIVGFELLKALKEEQQQQQQQLKGGSIGKGGGEGGGRKVTFVDFFDLTFPWHLHPCCSDGGHYGRPPYYKFWRSGAVYTGANNLGGDGGYSMVSAKKYVDVMLTQILLHNLCHGEKKEGGSA